ncbi:MAG: ribonuclease HII, partial [Candidatus Saccharimonas aalborgensis]
MCMILGIDEVGRGPWAGPLVVGAVVLGGTEIEGLADSKQLTKKQREALAPIIIEQAAAVALGWVTAT